MSRILGRALGGPAGPDPVRPRLPTRFEPGLEMASAPELVAGEPGAGGREDLEPSGPAAGERAGGVIGPAGRSEPREPADPAAGSPLAGPGSGSSAGRPVPGLPAGPGGRTGTAGQDGEAASGGLGGWAGSGGLDGQAGSGGTGGGVASGRTGGGVAVGGLEGWPGTAGLVRTPDAGLRRRERPERAYPVRPASAIPELAEPPAPPDGAAGPVRPAGQRSAAAMNAAAMSTGPARPDPGEEPGWAAQRRAARPGPGHAAAEPAVHITIGQVEIRADRAAAGEPGRLAARPGGRARRVAPDLSEYLQRRGQRR
jgi:hypothetical protein